MRRSLQLEEVAVVLGPDLQQVDGLGISAESGSSPLRRFVPLAEFFELPYLDLVPDPCAWSYSHPPK